MNNDKKIQKRLAQKGRPVKKSRLAKQGRDKIIVTTEELHFLEDKSDEGLSLKNLSIALKEKFNKSISHTTISTILKEADYRKPIVAKKSRIPVEYIFLLRHDKRLTLAEMKAITGMSETSLEYHLQKSDNQEKYLSAKIYKENKIEAFQYKQHELFKSLDQNKINAMSGSQLVLALSTMEEKIRLLKGESTEILTIEGLDKDLSALEEQELRIKKAIDITPDNQTSKEDAELARMDAEIAKLEKGLGIEKEG